MATLDPVAAAGGRAVTRIQPVHGWRRLGLHEFWTDRDLLFFLALRDIKVRYKQTFFGAAWAVGQPLLMMVVFAFVFGRLAHLPSEGVPYTVFVLAGLVPWGLVTMGLTTASLSLSNQIHLINKVRVPRVLVPTASVLGSVVDLGVATGLLFVFAWSYGIPPSWRYVALPAFALLGTLVVMGVALFLAAVNVVYRDVRYISPFLVQMWLFITPVAYSTTLVSSHLPRALYAANPMVGVVQGFRWSVLNAPLSVRHDLLPSIAAAVVIVALGMAVFRRLEPTFADVI